MNDGLLRVDFNALNDAGVAISNAVQQLDAKLAQLKADAKPLVDTWEGKAQKAYYDRQTTWENAATDLKTILSDIQLAVVKSEQEYAQTEGSAEKRFL
jgi:early secretory antigenic target protein ESAT-6